MKRTLRTLRWVVLIYLWSSAAKFAQADELKLGFSTHTFPAAISGQVSDPLHFFVKQSLSPTVSSHTKIPALTGASFSKVPAPEPSTILLGISGFGALLAFRRLFLR